MHVGVLSTIPSHLLLLVTAYVAGFAVSLSGIVWGLGVSSLPRMMYQKKVGQPHLLFMYLLTFIYAAFPLPMEPSKVAHN